MRRISLTLATALTAALLIGGPATAQQRDPVLFVHGWSSSGSVWDTMVDLFRADGYTDDELHVWSYNWAQANTTTAEQFLDQVDSVLAATGASRVDVVTHSMGGLSTRWCIKFSGCDGKVDAWVSLGGPNNGTRSAYYCYTRSCYDMRPGSRFLRTLNADDPTPGDSTRWGTWWSWCDGVISPSDSTVLDGAENTRTRCMGHNDLYRDAAVYAQVRDFVGR